MSVCHRNAVRIIPLCCPDVPGIGVDMSTLFWTYLNRTIYLMVYEFIVNNKIAFLALSRVK